MYSALIDNAAILAGASELQAKVSRKRYDAVAVFAAERAATPGSSAHWHLDSSVLEGAG
jgi:hypothetical protein